MKDAITYAHDAGFFSFNVIGWKAEFERLIEAVCADAIADHIRDTTKMVPDLATRYALDWIDANAPKAVFSAIEKAIEPVKRPPNCGTGYCSCVECVVDDMVKCSCGDCYQPDSFGAGFIAATGHCENCDTVEQIKQEQDHEYDLSNVIHLTHNKAKHIIESRGYSVTGFLLTNASGGKCIVDMSAVRWFDDKLVFQRMMHSDTPKEWLSPPIETIKQDLDCGGAHHHRYCGSFGD